ncbi:MAG: MBL fold metallo-hydrolase [Desulfovibrio sp.]|nr:MAG: MBL fold metallo-hydrolase [Desulfovibrio sp.]
MLVRFWGVRGSIPVSGADYARYGGDTACVELRTANDDVVVVDAGSGIRRLGSRLIEEGRKDLIMLFTHVHLDHILGFPFFRPLYQEGTHLLIFDCPMAQGDMHTLLSTMMAPPFFPIPLGDVKARVTHSQACAMEGEITISSMEVRSIPLSHPNLGLGYKFTEKDKTFVFLTDNELGHHHRGGATYKEYVEFCRDADLLVHDSEFTKDEYRQTKSWGHSTYTEALRLAQDAGVASFGLYHHNQDRSDHALDDMVEHCRQIVAADGGGPECFAVYQDQEITL